jgi:hypothetical protein
VFKTGFILAINGFDGFLIVCLERSPLDFIFGNV